MEAIIIEEIKKVAKEVIEQTRVAYETDKSSFESQLHELPGMSWVLSRNFINASRKNDILKDLYAFTAWRTVRADRTAFDAGYVRRHCVVILTKGDQDYVIDISTECLRGIPDGELPEIYIDEVMPWYLNLDPKQKKTDAAKILSPEFIEKYSDSDSGSTSNPITKVFKQIRDKFSSIFKHGD